MSDRFYNYMIMSDIDGTFLGRGSSIVKRNIEAVERFKAQGGLFTFASGRTDANIFTAIPNLVELVNAPLSLSNGCCLYDAKTKSALRNYFIKPGDGLEAALYLRHTYPDVGLRISDLGGFMYSPDDKVAENNVRRISPEKQRAVPESEWRDDDWYKVVMIGDPERLEEIRSDCISRYGNKFLYDKSGKHLLEIHCPERNKASMLGDMKEIYAARGREIKICAVGDFENDIDMLRHADISVCPSNATEDVKEIVDLCLCSNNDGVIADLVEYLESNV